MVDATDFHDDIVMRKSIEGHGLYAMLRDLPGTFYLILSVLDRLPDPVSEWILGHPVDRFFPYNRPLEKSRPWLGWIDSSAKAIAAYSRDALGARFYLVLGARNFQYSDRESPRNWERNQYTTLGPYVLEPERYFEERYGHGAFPYLSLLPAFRATTVFPTTFEDHPHWTPAGTRVAAEAILGFCLQQGCFR